MFKCEICGDLWYKFDPKNTTQKLFPAVLSENRLCINCVGIDTFKCKICNKEYYKYNQNLLKVTQKLFPTQYSGNKLCSSCVSKSVREEAEQQRICKHCGHPHEFTDEEIKTKQNVRMYDEIAIYNIIKYTCKKCGNDGIAVVEIPYSPNGATSVKYNKKTN